MTVLTAQMICCDVIYSEELQLITDCSYRLAFHKRLCEDDLFSNFLDVFCWESQTLTELQLRGVIEDNSKLIFLFLNENICCVELSR